MPRRRKEFNDTTKTRSTRCRQRMAGQGFASDDRPDFPTILQFFTDERTEDLVARQHALLKRIVQKCAKGFMLREMPVVAELLDVVPRRIQGLKENDEEESDDLERTLCNIIRICAKPGIRQKANEELLASGLAAAATIFQKLIGLQCSKSMRVAVEATRALAEVASPAGSTAAIRARKKLNRRLLLEARCVEGACARLEESVNQILAVDDDGTERKVFDARKTVDLIDADTSDEEPSEKRPKRKKKRSKKSAFSEVLTYATTKRTIDYAQQQLLRALVHLIRELSEDAAHSFRLVECGGSRACVKGLRLYLHDPASSDVLNITVEVLWNCLEHCAVVTDAASPPAVGRSALLSRRRLTNAMYQLSDDTTIAVLRQILQHLFLNGHKAEDKRLRNEVLIVASLIASHRKSHGAFQRQRLIHLLLEYACAAELPEDAIELRTQATMKRDPRSSIEPPLADRHTFATASIEDLETRRILWSVLSDLGRAEEENLQLVVEADFMGCLLMYLDVEALDAVDEEPSDDEEYDVVSRDTLSGRRIPGILKSLELTKLHVLQQQAMAVLLNLAPRAPQAFQKLKGHILALRFLDACSGEVDDSHSTDTNATKQSSRSADGLVRGALMLLISVVGLPGLQNELGALDGVEIMLKRFGDKQAGSNMRTDAVQILSKLCEHHPENQDKLRRSDGVATLISEIDRYVARRSPVTRSRHKNLSEAARDAMPSSSSAEKVDPLIVGVLDCLWNSVVGNRRSEARLPQSDGLDAILALLETGPRLMRLQVCGVLADLSRNPKLISYVRGWRSDKTMRSTCQLLAHAWEDEELRLGCGRARGVLGDTRQPLRRKKVREEATTVVTSTNPDSSDSDEELTVVMAPPPSTETTMKFMQRSAGGALQTSAAARAERALRQAVGARDLRSKIAPVYAALQASGDCGDEGQADDRATLRMVGHYSVFVDGEAWAAVRDQLKNAHVEPVAADRTLLDRNIGASVTIAQRTKADQEALRNEGDEEVDRDEESFFGSILNQRDQEIKQLIIKRNANKPKRGLLAAQKLAEEQAALEAAEDAED